jgi:hypothetical protein
MSTPEEPEAPQLTRRQLRELRDTASNPIITPEQAAVAAEATPVVAPLPRAAEPTVVAEEPPADDEVDLGSPALTRRSARQQERLRTASVPVVDAEAVSPEDAEPSAVPEPGVDPEDVAEAEAEAETAADSLAEAQTEAPEVEILDEALAPDASGEETDVIAEDPSDASDAERGDSDPIAAVLVPTDDEEDDPEEARPVVAPTFGSGLLAGEAVELELPASFDQLLTRGGNATGSLAASNALILSQTPETASLTAPIAATGAVLITGMFNLPESFGSTGTSHGSSDGKEIDAILVDGELPASSSPTPIAASAAISTIKSAEDIIKPPAPEKGGRLMMALVITAGALALALTGVLIVALVTGAFQ